MTSLKLPRQSTPSLQQTESCACVRTYSLAFLALPLLRHFQCPARQRITACAILTEMPELGHLSGKQAAALAGPAPISRQSGKWRGKKRIQGGRASVRRAIYLPAVVATRLNPDMKAKYEQLVSTGKYTELAITAVMRKLIVMANALLRDQRKWGEYPV